MSLRAYTKKRDFSRTSEPSGKAKAKRGEAHSFVIQKHDASRLHYDFRLEVDGTLKSWAVPKGVPYKRGDKALAVQVEDHPLAYADFEGVIPKGQYGGGTVMVWDRGTYDVLGGDAKKDLAEGKLHFALHGNKLDGEWALVRMKRSDDNEWLLIKSGEDMRPVSKERDDQSSISGRTMARIARERNAVWNSRSANPKFDWDLVPPMKATLVGEPPSLGHWIYELKFDGYRVLSGKNGDEVRLRSTNGKDFTKRYSEIADTLGALRAEQVILDGEIVALDDKGRSSFQLLQALETGSERPPLAYYVFDLLLHDGADLQKSPLSERRERLEKLLKEVDDPVRFSAEIRGDPKKLLEEVRKRGLEGLIGKRHDSVYEAGRRSRSWIKLKCVAEQEMVIGGYTPPEGNRKHFGALLVGYFERGKFRFAGKVGTGFDAALLKSLHQKMRDRSRATCPFANVPEKLQGRWSQNITPREMKQCKWVKPELVCQVRFTEWTRDGKLRNPVFIGLREDKSASEVVREKAS
jgi:bifunctional non-homologous end joining protein LigD